MATPPAASPPLRMGSGSIREQVLGLGIAQELPFSILASPSRDVALLVHETEHHSVVRSLRSLAVSGGNTNKNQRLTMSKPQWLFGLHPVAVWGASLNKIMSADRERICVHSLRQPHKMQCLKSQASHAVALANKELVLLHQRWEKKPVDACAQTADSARIASDAANKKALPRPLSGPASKAARPCKTPPTSASSSAPPARPAASAAASTHGNGQRRRQQGKEAEPSSSTAPASKTGSAPPRPQKAPAKTRSKPSRSKRKGQPSRRASGPQPRPKTKPRKKRRKGRKARRSREPKGLASSLWFQRIPGDGAEPLPAAETGLRYLRPLASMGLLQAVATKDGAQILYYEHLKAERKKKRWIPKARLRMAKLDALGHAIAGSQRTLLHGPRAYGYLQGHLVPRLLHWDDTVAFLGRSLTRTRGRTRIAPEGWLLPTGKLDLDRSILATDPSRLLDTSLTAMQRKGLSRLASLGPRLHAHQRFDRDGRVAWLAKDRGIYWKQQRLWLTKLEAAKSTPLPAPFRATRLALHWANQQADGHGLAATERGLTWRLPNGRLRQQPRRLSRAETNILAPPVRVGASWWTLLPDGKSGGGARLAQLWPQASPVASRATLYPDHSALVGGERAGLLLELNGNALRVTRIDETGKRYALGSYPSRLRPGFQAVSDGRGGAIVASTSGPRQALLIHINSKGTLRRRGRVPLRHRGQLKLMERENGAFLTAPPKNKHLFWIDADGKALGHAQWPQQTAPDNCPDGKAPRIHQPTSHAGVFRQVEAFRRGPCLRTAPVLVGKNALRWFGVQRRGLNTLAVAASLDLAPTPSPTQATPSLPQRPAAAATAPANRRLCPADMVQVRKRFCIDRYEAQLVDRSDGVALSPFYPTTPRLAQIILGRWVSRRYTMGSFGAQAHPLPPLLRRKTTAPRAMAHSRAAVLPSGYLTGHRAKEVCKEAGKRLCSHHEWRSACRGEQDRKFPYGASYRQGVCNVHRYWHPAKMLHGDAAIGHLDPRLSLLHASDGPLLRPTGSSPACASRWGDDAIYDMVGNLDEWVEKKSGAFAGGFYARATKRGCGALITVHPRKYLDYSLGVRCCKSIGRR
jgi:hypothetical protein